MLKLAASKIGILDLLIFDIMPEVAQVSVGIRQRATREEGKLGCRPAHADETQLPLAWAWPRLRPRCIGL